MPKQQEELTGDKTIEETKTKTKTKKPSYKQILSEIKKPKSEPILPQMIKCEPSKIDKI